MWNFYARDLNVCLKRTRVGKVFGSSRIVFEVKERFPGRTFGTSMTTQDSSRFWGFTICVLNSCWWCGTACWWKKASWWLRLVVYHTFYMFFNCYTSQVLQDFFHRSFFSMMDMFLKQLRFHGAWDRWLYIYMSLAKQSKRIRYPP